MKKILGLIKGNKFLFLIIGIYIVLLGFLPEMAKKSFLNSLYYIKEMVMILPVVLLITSLADLWISKDSIEKSLGKKSNIKGVILSFVLGSFSAGPIYAAFPVVKMLLKKGAKVSNVVIVLSAWAVIKVPMLANEAKFLGLNFMTVRWILTTIMIILLGYIVEMLAKPKVTEDEFDSSTLTIDQKLCIGCSICINRYNDIFEMKNKKACLINENWDKKNDDKTQEIIKICPVGAIK